MLHLSSLLGLAGATYNYTYSGGSSSSSSMSGATAAAIFIPATLLIILLIVALWRGLVPIISFIPVIGWIIAVVVSVLIALGVAKNFGKSPVFAVFGLLIFSFVGYLMLGFGKATYLGTAPAVTANSNGGQAPTSAEPFNPVEPVDSQSTPETTPAPVAAEEKPADNDQSSQPPTPPAA
jgi:hypothetical protein